MPTEGIPVSLGRGGCQQYLNGATIDYVEDLMEAQFQIKNPNANSTCGCGSSFSV